MILTAHSKICNGPPWVGVREAKVEREARGKRLDGCTLLLQGGTSIFNH